ncbi:unnamed protein product [Cutaneotrichosporon oleaginosum]
MTAPVTTSRPCVLLFKGAADPMPHELRMEKEVKAGLHGLLHANRDRFTAHGRWKGRRSAEGRRGVRLVHANAKMGPPRPHPRAQPSRQLSAPRPLGPSRLTPHSSRLAPPHPLIPIPSHAYDPG